MRFRGLTTIVVAGVLVLGVASSTTWASAGSTRQPSVNWHGCHTGPADELGAALDAAGAQCAEVTVPVDYNHPHGRKISVAMARIKATDPGRRRGILMLNPGGPGGSGMETVLINKLMPDVAAGYDLIGMDPRFVGRSSPIECQWKTDTFLRSAGPDRRTFDESVTLTKELAAGCARGNLDLLPYASTRNTARDMDLIRRALGEQKLSYLGYSYGTYLGAVYLQMFGSHADRVVLDSPVDPDVFGPGLISHAAPAIQAALEHWATWAAGRDSEYGLGGTPGEVLATVDRINQASARSPLKVGTYTVDSHVLPYFLFAHLYDDSTAGYADLAEQLRVFDAAARGGPATPTFSLETFLAGLFTGAGYAADRAGTAVICADRAASRDPDTYFRDIESHRHDEPLFGPLAHNITPCAFWPTRPAEKPTTIRTDVPALIVGADGDPVAPYPGQQAMHGALTGSRMVTLRGGFAHTEYLAAENACVDGTVNRYLVDGAFPTRDTDCVVGS
ncbi:alpha/beta hydrolase [Pseudofrankia sp. BMG5.36]|uniref:alpha/beta hydrolase n=1 Tax=Pseudofrankia sp. BMG5.36 TaxID=1834512 RepID=UPI0008D9619A|nr:alpha/beta hydrolase [Pseudofrankia sp. BMG5.36]OHV45742.1 alpha/beta hydrolase [Pseudofrankia sp. BMG5.36]